MIRRAFAILTLIGILSFAACGGERFYVKPEIHHPSIFEAAGEALEDVLDEATGVNDVQDSPGPDDMP